MGKKRAKRARSYAPRTTLHKHGEQARSENVRNPTLDVLRGVAIVLMVIDHTADMLWQLPILPTNVRMATRLAMPIFCVLAGYFLLGRLLRAKTPDSSKSINWGRVGQVAFASFLASFVTYVSYQRLEILASILVVMLVFPLVGRWFPLAVGLVVLASVDPSSKLFDYPITVVAACMAAGGVVRLGDWRKSVVCGLGVVLASAVVPAPTCYVLWWTPVAIALVHLSEKKTPIRLSWLEAIGRFPLRIYVAQYYVLWLIQYATRNS